MVTSYIILCTYVKLVGCCINKVLDILYYDQQMSNYFTSYHTPTCFETIVSS